LALLFGDARVLTGTVAGALALMGIAPAVALYVRMRSEK